MDTFRYHPTLLKCRICALIILSSALFSMLQVSIPSVGAQEECYEYDDLRIVLTWDTNQTDIDLHTYDPEGNHAWYNNLGGIPGGNLDYDDVDGFGPENFTMAEPITGTYQIRLHYYADHNGGAAVSHNGQARSLKRDPTSNVVSTPNALATTATVRVFVGSVLKFTASQTLTGVGQWWDAHSFTICGGKPFITAVTPEYKLDNTRFLAGIAVQNPIKVKVNWLGNAPGRVEFKLNNQIIATKEAAGHTVEHTLNMGTDLTDGRNTLEIVAKAGDTNGQQSEPKTFQFYSIPQPIWIAGLVNFGLSSLPLMASGNVGGGASYEMTFRIPNQPFTIEALRFGPPDGKVKFEWEAGGKFVIPIDCSTPPSARISANGGIKFWSSSIGLTGYGGIESQRSDACGFLPPNGFAGAKIEFTDTLYRKPVLVMISYFNVVVGQTVDTIIMVLDLEEFIGKLGEFYVDGTLSLDAQTKIELVNNQTQFLKFKDLSLDGSVGIQGGFRSDLVVVEVDVYAGASGGVTFLRPGEIAMPLTSSWQFDKLTLKGEVGAKFRALWFTREAKGEISWTYPPTAAQLAGFAEQMHVGEWQLIPPMRALAGQPLQLQPNVGRTFVRPEGGASAGAPLGLHSTVTEVLVSNVYTYPEVTLALNPSDDQALLLWTNTDNSKTVGQAQEIYASTWSGGWTTPTLVTNDLLLDGAPQVAWTGGNQAVALWQRLNTVVAPDATLTITTTRQVEIATATFDPATAAWSPVTLLTNNSALDFMPHLARNNNGQLLAVWRRNPTGQLGGDATNPEQVIAAFYNNNSWGTPSVALDNLPGLVDLSAGYSNANAMIAYTRNLVATGAVTPTGQLFVSTWDGLTWSVPVQITNDNRNHRDPQLLYNNAGQPLLLWLADNELNLLNLATNGTQRLALPTTLAGIDELRALRDASGNVAAVFVSKSLPRDLYVVFYDEATQLWSNPRRLTNDNKSEAYLAPAFDSQDRLLMGYATTALDLIPKTTIANGEVITYTLPQPTQTDLATLSHSFERNLTLTDTDLTVSQLNPAPGNTLILTARIKNSGDKPVQTITVDFYADAALIHSAMIPGPLTGNSQMVVTTTFTINSLVHTLYALVDAAGNVVESNEFDNEAQRPLIGPDVEIVDTRVRYWGGANADLTTIVRNKGHASMPDTALVYRHEDAAATEVARDFIPSLSAGEVATLTTYLNLMTFPPGRYPMLVAAEVDTTVEFDAENNHSQFIIQILPDLHTAAQSLLSSPLNQPTVLLTATVANLGAATSPTATVGFYRSSDTTNRAAQLAIQSLAAITPTGAVQITQQVAGPLCRIYVSVDPTGGVDELTKANNVSVVTQPIQRCVDFYFAPISGTTELPPYTVQFTDFSFGENNAWRWDFGDGNHSNEQHPRHTYGDQGSYTVTLTVSGADGSHSLRRAALINVTGAPNLAPIANNDAITTMRNTPIIINVLSNDNDPNGDPLTVSTVASPQNGSATTDGTTITYTPATAYIGVDSFSYTLMDSKGATATAAVTVEIIEANRAPAAVNDNFVVSINSSNNALNVRGNDGDPDEDPLTINTVAQPQHGIATTDGTTVFYTPVTDFAGTDIFIYTIQDSKGATASATVTVAIQIDGQSGKESVFLPLIQR